MLRVQKAAERIHSLRSNEYFAGCWLQNGRLYIALSSWDGKPLFRRYLGEYEEYAVFLKVKFSHRELAHLRDYLLKAILEDEELKDLWSTCAVSDRGNYVIFGFADQIDEVYDRLIELEKKYYKDLPEREMPVIVVEQRTRVILQ